ncbi:MAG: GNAT family N-acetyltransferase [Paracoccaceae bacterium]
MLTIRAATPADIPALLPLNAIVQDWHATHYPDRFRKSVDPEHVSSFFETMIEGDTTFVDLALWDAKPAGYLFTRLNAHDGSPFTLPSRQLHVEHIAVGMDHRRKGIATALIACATDRAQSLGCSEVNLTSWDANVPAHTAFRSTGFEMRRLWFAKSM